VTYVEIYGLLIPRLAIGLSILLIYLIVAFTVRRLFIGYVERLAQKSATMWDNAVVVSVRRPLTLLILAFGGWIIIRYMQLPHGWNRGIDVVNQIAVVCALILFVDRLLRESVDLHNRQLGHMNLTPDVVRFLVRVCVLILGGLILLGTLNISITPILASLGVGGLAVGLALQGTLSNLFAGIQIISTKPIRVGDFIRLESGEEGFVTEIGWRATHIRMLPNNVVIIPNSKLADSVLVNYNLPDREMAVLVQVGVSYASDLAHVERVTIEVAKDVQQSVPGGVRDFVPFIRYHTFGDSSINFSVILRGKEFVDQHLIKHEFIKRLHARYNQEGIVIPWPIRTLDLSRKALDALANSGKGDRP